jgi:hypothetical protein
VQLPYALSHRQMSMFKPVGPNMATATPLGPPGGLDSAEAARRVARVRRRRHPPPADVFPRAQHRRSLLSAASSYPDTYAASGPGPGTWKDPDPRRRSSRGSGAQNGPARQWWLRDACGLSRLNDFLALWSQAHTRSCSRQVTSTSIRMVKPGPAGAPRGHAPL